MADQRTVRARKPPRDEPRAVVLELLRAVAEDGAYGNLVLPGLIDVHNLSGRDAALATELGYGTLRSSGTLDQILAACTDRPLDNLDPDVRQLLRLGAYQLLRTRVPPHAAVATTVELARSTGNARATGYLNAVLRAVSRLDWDGWIERLSAHSPPIERIALQTAHPVWICQAFLDVLDGDLDETRAALAADDARPQTHLVAWPGRIGRDELARTTGGAPGPYSPYAVLLERGNPADIAAVRDHRAGVQDEGSQLCAVAFTGAQLDGPDERWLDMCAGPGGKTALLAAIAADRGAQVVANELHQHRADLVRSITTPWDVDIRVGDARAIPDSDGGYDRVLLDAPCTGLGALRRRPEARWRRTAEDVAPLADLQRDLLHTALRLVRPGGLVAYVTCSPHRAETLDVVAGHDLLDARPAFARVDQLGAGPTVQLWPHRHGTDAMFFALLRRADTPA